MNSEKSTHERKATAAFSFPVRSHLKRMLCRLDSRDKELEPEQRKRKWTVVVLSLFALFLVSFLLPSPDFKHQKIGAGTLALPQGSAQEQKLAPAGQAGFEMPVDSFETLLKQHIHEQLPEKK